MSKRLEDLTIKELEEKAKEYQFEISNDHVVGYARNIYEREIKLIKSIIADKEN